jgi:peptidoglycan hydrolase-like protein with peptidoglycan-binding domain
MDKPRMIRPQFGSRARRSTLRTLASCAAAMVCIALLAAACSSSKSTSEPTTTATTRDPVTAAEARVAAAESGLDAANAAFTSAGKQFCSAATGYVTALDRYGKLFTDSKATVGDVKTGGADLVAPRESVSSAADGVAAAQSGVVGAQKELADAQAALADARATASSVPNTATTAAPPTTTTLVPRATITRVKQAESDLATTSSQITDNTPLIQATAAYNSAAFALQIAWLKLLSDAGCLTDAQQAQAVAQVTEYTVALQTDLQLIGLYKGPIDGIYGPQTVDAVMQLQTESGLPPTGLVDQATALALDKKLAAAGVQATQQALTQTAALQTVLKLTGQWTGPVDGTWTPELTDALKTFQSALGVQPTGAVDAATLAAFEQALAELQIAATTTTTTAAPPSTTTAAPAATTAAPTTTETATTAASTTSTG